MDLEEIYMTLYGASQSGEGAKFEIVEKWFKECEIIDEKTVTSQLFEQSFKRVNPNKQALSLVQFVQLLGILSRDTDQEVDTFAMKFKAINQRIIQEIQTFYD